MGLDRRLGQDEVLGDLGVAHGASDQRDDLLLPIGQSTDGVFVHGAGSVLPGAGWACGVTGRGEPPLQQPARGRRRHHRVSSGHGADTGQELGRRRVLEQEARGPGPHRRHEVVVQIEGGQDEHLQVGVAA